MIKQVRRFLLRFSGPAFWTSIGLLLVGMILIFKLAVLVPGASDAEVVAKTQTTTIEAILNNPLYLPHKLLEYGIQQITGGGILSTRGVSAVFGMVTVCMFFYVLRAWHTTRVAIFATLLFTTSSWFLHTARNGTPDVMMMSMLALLLAGIWLREHRRRWLALLAVALMATVLIYIPGMVWFVLVAAIWQHKLIAGELRRINSTTIILAVTVGLILLAPIGYALFNDIHLYKPFLGLPDHFSPPLEMLKNLGRIPVQLFAHGPDDPTNWLGRTPILDVFSSVMLVLGIYAYWFRLRLDRTKFLIAFFTIGSLLVALDGPVTMTLLMPFIYVVIAAGVTLMLQQWFTVFPRNPLARTIGSSLLSVAILLACTYHVTHYFIAWPNTPATKAIYNKHLPS